MAEGLEFRYNEETGLWEEYAPFASVDVMTEEEFNNLKAAIEHYRKRGTWVDRYGGKYANSSYVCSVCKNEALWKPGIYDVAHSGINQFLSPFCPHCGVKMEGKIEHLYKEKAGFNLPPFKKEMKEEGKEK